MRALLRLAIALVAATMMVVGLGLPATAQDEPEGTVAAQFDDEVQILSAELDEQSGVVELTVAIPPSLGEVQPEASNFALLQGTSRRGLLVEEVRNEVDVILVVDTSGSMRGEAIAAARTAAVEFVDQMPEGARIAVVGFGPTPVVTSELTNDRAASKAAITSLTASGETALWDALVAAGELIESQGRTGRYIVVLSDGADTVSSATLDDAVLALSKTSNPAGLYVVTLETPESDHSGLNEAATRLNGQVLTTASSAELQPLYAEIAGRLQNRYSIRFRPNSAESVVLSVAVDDSIATARTSLSALGLSTESDDSTTGPVDEEIAQSLNGFGASELGTVIVPEPGLLGQPSALWIGAGTLFAALAVVFSLLAVPAMRVQPIGAARAADPRAQAARLNDRLSGAADRIIRERDQSGSLDRTLDAAGLEIRAGEFVVMAGVFLLCIGAVVSVVQGSILALMAIAATAIGIVVYVNLRVRKRRQAFADQLQNTITIITSSLRAGRGLPQAVEMVAQEAAAPTCDEFRRVVIETRVGRDPIVAMDAVAARMANQDLEWISQAIAINRELGGDLIELLDNVAGTVRERNRLKLQVRSLSAEGRMSGWVMLSLPFGMYAYLRVVNPDYVDLLHTTVPGLVALIAGLLAMLGGGIWIRKLVDIKY